MIRLPLAALLLFSGLAHAAEVEALDAASADDAPAPPKTYDHFSAQSLTRVVMFPLSSLGSTDDAAQAVQQILVGEMRKLLGDKLVAPKDLEKVKSNTHIWHAVNTCEGVVVCLTELVGAMGWDAFISGTLVGLGENRVINLKLFDARSGMELRKTSVKASGDEAELIKSMRRAAVELLAPELFVGTLEVVAAQPSVTIVVDGESVGVTPLTNAKINVPVGRRAVEAQGEGLVPFSTFVDVGYEETVTVTINLPQNTVFVGGDTPFRARWWTWAIAGAGAIGMGLGAFFNLEQRATAARIERQAQECQEDPAACRLTAGSNLYEQSSSQWGRARVFYGIGGVLLAGAGVLVTLDLFE